MELPAVIRELLGFAPTPNWNNHRMDEENIKPMQPGKLRSLFAGSGTKVVTRKYDGEGVIVLGDAIKRKVTVYSRNAKVPGRYLETLFDFDQPALRGVTSFKFAGEETAMFDKSGEFPNPAEMPEMGYALVKRARKFCEKNPAQNAVRMHVFGFRLIELNGMRGSALKKEDELELLSRMLAGQRHFHAVKWFNIDLRMQGMRIWIQREKNGEYVDFCDRDDLAVNLHRIAGTFEGFVVFDNTEFKGRAPEADHKGQLRDYYAAKARALFTAVLKGRVYNRRGIYTLVLCCDRDRDTDIELVHVKYEELDPAIKTHLANHGGEVYLEVKAPNLSITTNHRGFRESRLLGVYQYMRVVPDAQPRVTHIDDLIAQRPHWGMMDKQAELFEIFERQYAPPARSPSPPARRAPSPPSPLPAKAPAKTVAGMSIYIWQEWFTPQEVKKMGGRIKNQGGSLHNARNKALDAVLVSDKCNMEPSDSKFAVWYQTVGFPAPIYLINKVDPYCHQLANAHVNYCDESDRYVPTWPVLKKLRRIVKPAPESAPAGHVAKPAPAEKPKRTQLWPAEHVHVWPEGFSPEEMEEISASMRQHAYAVNNPTFSRVEVPPPLEFFCDILILSSASVMDIPGVAQRIRTFCARLSDPPIIVPVSYVRLRLRAFPDFISPGPFIIPLN